MILENSNKGLYFIVVIIILLILFFVWYSRYRKDKDTPIQLVSGRVGGGKSFSMTYNARRMYKRSMKAWQHINKPSIIIRIFESRAFPFGARLKNRRERKELYGLDKPYIYSNYPIVIKYKRHKEMEISRPITNDIMLLKKSIPMGSIVVIDEFSSWIDQFHYKEIYSNVLNDHIQKWRHYHGNNSRLLIADQCTNNIPIQVRYRCNTAICYLNTKHILKFIHISEYKKIDMTDDIKSVEIVEKDNSDTDDKILKVIRFQFKRYYDERAYSNRYTYINDNALNYKYMESQLKVNQPMATPNDKKYIKLDDRIEQTIKDNKNNNEN